MNFPTLPGLCQTVYFKDFGKRIDDRLAALKGRQQQASSWTSNSKSSIPDSFYEKTQFLTVCGIPTMAIEWLLRENELDMDRVEVTNRSPGGRLMFNLNEPEPCLGVWRHGLAG